MQAEAHLPEEGLRLLELAQFGRRQEAVREQLVERARAEVALGHPGDGLDVAQAAGAGLDVRLQVVGRVIGLDGAGPAARQPWPRSTPSPARRDRPTRRRASRQQRALPASRRASMSVVITPTSATLSSAHSSTVRTLWPTSRLMSQRKVTTRSTTPRPASSGARGHQDQDVDVGMRMQFAAAVTADRRQRPVVVAGGQLRAPDLAQDGVDELGARVHQRLDRLVGAETLGQFGVRSLSSVRKASGADFGGREAFGQLREPQPGRAAQ